jgi:heme oxygenase
MAGFPASNSMPRSAETPPPDPLAALRAATASRHELLDSSLPIGAPDATLADYAAHLRLLRAWLAPLEKWLDGFPGGPDGACAERLALIEADLHDAAQADPSGDDGAGAPHGPAMPPLPAAASAAYRWGVCYVVEGSQLGGTVLYQRLHERLAPHPLRYLKGEAAGPGKRWRAFMAALREAVRSEADIADACAGACAAFDRILALQPEASRRAA